jgi:hypothetical protein
MWSSETQQTGKEEVKTSMVIQPKTTYDSIEKHSFGNGNKQERIQSHPSHMK